MATANRFQTRVLIPEKISLTNNEIRLNSLLSRAQTCVNALNEFQTNQNQNCSLRLAKLNGWALEMLEKVDKLYKICSDDLKQTLDQLKYFKSIMISILNNENEINLDGKKLNALENEICILKCLVCQLDTTKVKIEGQLKLNEEWGELKHEVAVDDTHSSNQFNQTTLIKEEKDFTYRILIEKELLNKIENLHLFQEFVQMSTNEIDETTPERILTINGPQHLDVIKEILSNLYSPSANNYELRILLHQSYAPLILGKLGDRSKILRDKYSLHALKIYPTCAPESTERILLIQSSLIDRILSCLEEIFNNIREHVCDEDEVILYDETKYDATLVDEYGGFISPEILSRLGEQGNHSHSQNNKMEDDQYAYDNEENDDGIRRYSAYDAWTGSVEADTDQEFSVVKLGDDSIIREFWINHGQFGALLGPHGVRIAQIRAQCRTVRIHTVAGSSIDTCSVKVIGPRIDVNHAVNLIFQSIKEHDRKFPFKHHRFSGRLR